MPGLPPESGKSMAIGQQEMSKGRQGQDAANLVQVCQPAQSCAVIVQSLLHCACKYFRICDLLRKVCLLD